MIKALRALRDPEIPLGFRIGIGLLGLVMWSAVVVVYFGGAG